jgi:metalloendopeptidase OMA1, mitochondrial
MFEQIFTLPRCFRFSTCLLFSTFVACAPVRPPVPPGVIPKSRPVTIEEEQYGHTVLQELQQQYPIVYGDPNVDRVEKIVDRLSKAAGADKDPWHVFVLSGRNVKNAAATRGNHVFVWTGMFDAVRSDAELAAIIAHEMSHVLANHTDPDPNEEVKKILISVGALAAGIAVSAATQNVYISSDLGNITSALTEQVGSGFVLNPYSRERELEADRIGLLLMAQAGYDPRAADEFWSRAAQDPSFSASIPFFSTHPVADERLTNIRSNMDAAEARFRGDAMPPVMRPGGASSDSISKDSFDVAAPTPRLPERTDSSNIDPQASDSRPSDRGYSAQPDSGLSAEPPKENYGNISRPRGSDYANDGEWQVVSPRAVLRRNPSARANAIGEFPRGVRIRPIARSRGWLEIETPDHGFLREADLEKVVDPR